MSSPQLQIAWRVSWKLWRNLCSRRWLRPSLDLIINLIPLGLWQLKIVFEDGLINLKILFLKAEKVLEFFISRSKLFYSMTVDGKKRIYKKNMFTTEEGNLTCCIVCFVNARKYSEEIRRQRMIFKNFEKVTELSIPSSFTEWF